MQILGLGTDIVEISRIRASIENEHFIKRFFTENEMKYAENKTNREQTYAGIFCAKESIVKAYGTGFRDIKFVDIEILHDELGKPFSNDKNIILTISHCKEYATATAIFWG